jgi:hypothetical protein
MLPRTRRSPSSAIPARRCVHVPANRGPGQPRPQGLVPQLKEISIRTHKSLSHEFLFTGNAGLQTGVGERRRSSDRRWRTTPVFRPAFRQDQSCAYCQKRATPNPRRLRPATVREAADPPYMPLEGRRPRRPPCAYPPGIGATPPFSACGKRQRFLCIISCPSCDGTVDRAHDEFHYG